MTFIYDKTAQYLGSPRASKAGVDDPPAPPALSAQPAATTFAVTLSAAAGLVGAAVTVSYAPLVYAWPAGLTITPSSTVAGTFSPATLSPSGTGAVFTTFTPSAAGTATISATIPGLTTTLAKSYAVTAPATPPPANTFTPAHTGTKIPNVKMSWDASVTASTVDPPAGTAGISIDANNGVVGMVEPVTLTGAYRPYDVGTVLATGGPGGYPYFHSAADIASYDAFLLPTSAADQFFLGSGEAWFAIIVMRQLNNAANGIIEYRSNTFEVRVGGGGTADGALYVEQNNGAAYGLETSSALTALNQWQIVSVLCNGSSFAVFRNGIRTLQTADGAIGSVSGDRFMVMNNAQADVALIMMATGSPSLSQHNQEVTRLGARYGITVSNVVDGPTAAVAPLAPDSTANFSRTMNNPITDTLPTIAGNTVGNGIVLNSGATQYFTMRIGSNQAGANITTSQQFRDLVYCNYGVGYFNDPIGQSQDTGTYEHNFMAVARHYPIGDPNDLIPVLPDGVHVKAMCSGNRTNCTFRNIYGGMFRLPAVFHPGMVIKVRRKQPKGRFAWHPIWLYSGEQRTPYPGTDAYVNSNARITFPNKKFEIDIDDNFERPDTNGQFAPAGNGHTLSFQTPNIYGTPWNVAPYEAWSVARYPGQNGFATVDSGLPYIKNDNYDATEVFQDVILNWRDDGSNLIDVFENGKLVMTRYMEFSGLADCGMHLIISAQIGARFNFKNGADGQEVYNAGAAYTLDQVTDNDGITDGWTMVVQEISAWYGTVVNPNSYRATTNT